MDLLFRNARIDLNGPLVDVLIDKGTIIDIEPSIAAQTAQTIDATGKVLIPGLIESHLHFEKALVSDRKANRSGTLQEALAITAALKPTFTKEDIYERASRVIRMLVSHGTTCVRAHAEFDPSQGFTGVDTVLALKEDFKDVIDIQVVAFPQEGIFKAPGTEQMMHEAIKRCDVVGAIPYNDTDAKSHIDLVFNLAREYGKDLDFHQDFNDNADNITIDYVAKKTLEFKYQGRVSVGHLTSLGALPPEELKPIANLMAEAGISVMCLPATDLHLGGRKDTYNVRRAITPVRALRDAGVNMCLATNNIRNAFTPFGNGDLFQIAALAIPACHLGGADDLATVLPMLTVNPAKALKLKDYGLFKGAKADMILLDTTDFANLLLDMPERLCVVKSGKLVAQVNREQKFSW